MIIAFKRFRLMGGILLSPLVTTIWAPGQTVRATCSRGNHVPPGPGCDCGIWTSLAVPESPGVLGLIECWGDMIREELVVRSEYGRVVGVVRSPEVADRYGVADLEELDAVALVTGS